MALKVHPDICLRFIREHFHTRDGSNSEFVLRLKECPLCGHDRWAVRFNAFTQRLTCYRHAGDISFLDLVKKLTGCQTTREVFRHLKTYGELSFSWDKSAVRQSDRKQAFLDLLKAPKSYGQRASVPLDLSHFSCDWSTAVGSAIRSYGEKRNLPPELLDGGCVGYFRRGPLSGRLSFLIYENGSPVFAVGRAIRSDVAPKYLYPSSAVCGGRGLSNTVYNLDAVQPGDVVPLAEGIISAISADPKALAMLGNSLTDIQASKIAARKPGAVFYLRESGINSFHAQESVSRLVSKGLDCYVADLTDGDPNDCPEQMPQVLAAAQEVTRQTLFFSRLEHKRILLNK